MSTFIAVKNGIPEGDPFSISQLQTLCPVTSFPLPITPDDLKWLEYGLYETTPAPAVGDKYEKIVPGALELGADSVWRQSWDVIEMTTEEKAAVEGQQASRIRSEVQAKLQASDWTQLPDAPLGTEKKTEWVGYRAKLRDVSEQEGFPWEVVWPEAP